MKPSSEIPKQSQTATPVTGDATIMDDTVVLMDGDALMGGPNTSVEDIRNKAYIIKAKSSLPPYN